MGWKKPAISIYRERFERQETEPFAVTKAQKITVTPPSKLRVEK
jgi:hypothetical protein